MIAALRSKGRDRHARPHRRPRSGDDIDSFHDLRSTTEQVVAVDQREHRQIFPQPGWVEHDPVEIWSKTTSVIEGALSPCRLEGIRARGRRSHQSTGNDCDMGSDDRRARAQRNRLAGHTNRRPLCRASRGRRAPTDSGRRPGFPLATYFSGPKARYLIDHLDLGERAERGELSGQSTPGSPGI